MKKGYLSQYFDGVAVKILSAVEADVLTSNQHEFNGVEGLKKMLGEPEGKEKYQAKFLYLTDNDDCLLRSSSFLEAQSVLPRYPSNLLAKLTSCPSRFLKSSYKGIYKIHDRATLALFTMYLSSFAYL